MTCDICNDAGRVVEFNRLVACPCLSAPPATPPAPPGFREWWAYVGQHMQPCEAELQASAAFVAGALWGRRITDTGRDQREAKLCRVN